MKLIIAGGRDYEITKEDHFFLNDILLNAGPISEVVSGGARGADSAGKWWAARTGIKVKVFKADWDTHGKAAGPIRNREMAKYADAVVLFPGGRGTNSMYEQAKAHGLTIYDRRDK